MASQIYSNAYYFHRLHLVALITHLGNFAASAPASTGRVDASELITRSLRWRFECMFLLSTLRISRLCRKSVTLSALQGRGLTTIASFSLSLSSLDISSATTHLFHLSFTFWGRVDFFRVVWRSWSFYRQKKTQKVRRQKSKTFVPVIVSLCGVALAYVQILSPFASGIPLDLKTYSMCMQQLHVHTNRHDIIRFKGYTILHKTGKIMLCMLCAYIGYDMLEIEDWQPSPPSLWH